MVGPAGSGLWMLVDLSVWSWLTLVVDPAGSRWRIQVGNLEGSRRLILVNNWWIPLVDLGEFQRRIPGGGSWWIQLVDPCESCLWIQVDLDDRSWQIKVVDIGRSRG